MAKSLRFLLYFMLVWLLASTQIVQAAPEPGTTDEHQLLEKSLTAYELDREIASLIEQEVRLKVQISETTRAANDTEWVAEQRRERAKKVIQAYYTGERTSIWMAILSTSSIRDAIYVWEQLQMILARDKQTIKDYMTVYRNQKETAARLESERRQLAELRASYVAEKQRRERLQSELDAELSVRADRHMLEQEMKQITTQWEEKGLPLFQTYFGALAKLMPQLPDMLLKTEGALSIKGFQYTLRITDEQLNEFLHSKDQTLTGFAFQFEEDHITAGGQAAEHSMTLSGRYAIQTEPANSIRFHIDSLTYNGFLLPDTTARSLERKFDLSFYPQKLIPFLYAYEVKTEPGLLTIALKLSL